MRKLFRTSSVKRRRPSLTRRLSIQSLENRRVLAATITALSPSASGFTAELSEQVNTVNLNLYDTQGQVAGAADVTLRGATTGLVRGSLLVEGTRVSFIASGGTLAPDTYTATLRSAADAFTDLADGELLDGNNDGVAGGDFVGTFTVDASTAMTVGLPDFVRGPGQTLQAPATGSGAALQEGWPIRLSNSAGLTSLTMTIQYDPTLLDISDVRLGSDAMAGSQVESNLTSPGNVTISFFALTPLTGEQTDIIQISATVPETAAYGTAHVLRIANLEVNAGAMDAIGDDGIHLIAYPGDVNANRRYDAEDARLIARVGVGLDTGFVFSEPTSTTATTRLFPNIDPVLLGDVTGVDGISPLDASDLLRRVVGLSTPNLPDIPVLSGTNAPTNLTLSPNSVQENQPVGTLVGTLATVDPDTNQSHTYTLVTGSGSADNASFTIVGNELRSNAVFDANTKTSYDVRVMTTDSTGLSFPRAFVVSVTPLNVAPTVIALSNSSVAENVSSGTVVGTLSTTDSNANNTHTYSIVSVDFVTGDGPFAISGSTLTVTGSLDFETKSSYSVIVRSTDQGGLSLDQTFTISVANVNETPTDISLSTSTIVESAAIGSTVGLLSTTDPDAGDTHTYALAAGTGDTDNGSFTIVGDELQTNVVLDFAATPSYSIRVMSTDADGLSTEKEFTITVTEVVANSAPTDISLSTSTIVESAAIGSTVGMLSTTDADAGDTHTYALAAGTGDTDNGSFTIVGDELQTNVALDFATTPSYSIRVMSTDADGLSTEKEFTITVTEVVTNSAPTDISLSTSTIVESAAVGSTVGLLSTTDADAGDTHTYALAAGTGDTDNGSFTIVGDELQTNVALDFAATPSYSIRVMSTDADGLSTEKEFTITVTEVVANSAPTDISLSTSTIAESAAVGSTVGMLSTTDPDASDTHTYALAAGTGDTDNGSFTIVGDELQTNVALDFATTPSYSIRVMSTDADGLSTEKEFTITVTEVVANSAPTDISLSTSTIVESAAIGSVVGMLSTTDPDAGDTHTYALAAGTGDTDNGSFTIVGDELQTNVALDFATTPSYSIRVMSTDADGLSTEKEFTITVTEVVANSAPTDISLSTSTIAESAAVGSTVGLLSTTDADAGDTHTYALAAGTGDTDNGSFTIVGDELQTNVALDFATTPSYSIRVMSTDADGLSTEKEFTITVTEVVANSAPTDISLSTSTIVESAAIGSTVGLLSTTDADAGDTHTYALAAGTGDTDNGSFTIVGDELQTNVVLDFAATPSYSIRVMSTDADGLSTEKEFTITVTEVVANSAPTDISLSTSTIAESAAIGSAVGMLSTTDPDASDTHTYALAAGTGDTDNGSFTIVGDELQTNVVLDFAATPSYSIRVMSTDADGLSTEKEFTITVTEVVANSAPTDISLSTSTIAESAAIGSAVGMLSTTDPDASDTHTYALAAGTGDTDNGSFTIVGDELQTNVALDFATTPSYSIRVMSTDADGLSTEKEFTITVTEVVANSAPTDISLSTSTIAESAAVGSTVGLLSTTDADAGDTHTYALAAGTGDTDNGSFTIVGDELQTNVALDFATTPSYSIRVMSTDADGLSTEKEFTITVTEVVANSAPTDISLSTSTIVESAAIGSTVGLLSTTDADAGDTHTYALAAGTGDTDNGSFTIVGDELQTNVALDFATTPSYSIRVMSTDADGLSTEKEFTITVTEVVANSAPTDISLSTSTIVESAAIGSTVGLLSTTDADAGDTHTYALAAGTGDTDNGSFTIVGDELQTNVALDFAATPSYSIRVMSTDADGLSTEKEFTITVTEVVANSAPTDISLSTSTIVESAAIGSVVGMLSTTDPDAGDTHTYALAAGTGDTDNGSFTIVGDELQTNVALDFAATPSYSIRVMSTDADGLSTEKEFTITVTEVVANSAPTDISLSTSTIVESAAIGSVVGMLSTTDADAGDTHTYALAAGTGDTDNGSFTIVGDELQTNVALDFATTPSYSIRVMSTDADGLSTEKEFTITVTDVDQAPTAIEINRSHVATGQPANTFVGDLSTVDPDTGDMFTYSIVDDGGNAVNAFTIANGQLFTSEMFDDAIEDLYSLRVRTEDASGLSFEQTLDIIVSETNEGPTAVTLSNSQLAMSSTAGATVGSLTTLDANTLDDHVYALVSGLDDTDNAMFVIEGNTLRTNVDMDAASQTTFSIRVQSVDRYGLSFEQVLTLTRQTSMTIN